MHTFTASPGKLNSWLAFAVSYFLKPNKELTKYFTLPQSAKRFFHCSLALSEIKGFLLLDTKLHGLQNTLKPSILTMFTLPRVYKHQHCRE